MAYKAKSTLPATGTPTAQATSPAGTMTLGGSTPKIVSVAQASPAAAPTKAPLSCFVVAGALLIGIALLLKFRTRK